MSQCPVRPRPPYAAAARRCSWRSHLGAALSAGQARSGLRLRLRLRPGSFPQCSAAGAGSGCGAASVRAPPSVWRRGPAFNLTGGLGLRSRRTEAAFPAPASQTAPLSGGGAFQGPSRPRCPSGGGHADPGLHR